MATSLPFFPLFSVFLIVIVPGIYLPPVGEPSSLKSLLISNPIVPPLELLPSACFTSIPFISSLWTVVISASISLRRLLKADTVIVPIVAVGSYTSDAQ